MIDKGKSSDNTMTVNKFITDPQRLHEIGVELVHMTIKQAIVDYKYALRGKRVASVKPEKVIADCERFFNSDDFAEMSPIAGERIITMMREKYSND